MKFLIIVVLLGGGYSDTAPHKRPLLNFDAIGLFSTLADCEAVLNTPDWVSKRYPDQVKIQTAWCQKIDQLWIKEK